jgi:hypothetical protein
VLCFELVNVCTGFDDKGEIPQAGHNKLCCLSAVARESSVSYLNIPRQTILRRYINPNFL